MFKAVLFDLDGTLFETSKLKPFRDTQNWAFVLAHLSWALPFEGTPRPHELLAQLKSTGVQVGVVTSSARKYAEQLLELHGVPYDVLVTGSDGFARKPDPATLVHAVTQLGVSATDAAYVGDELNDVHAAAAAGMTSIGAGWSWKPAPAHAPDFLVETAAYLLQLSDRWRPFAEAELMPPVEHLGSVIEDQDGISLGRYFTNRDLRHDAHPLSIRLLEQKTQDNNAAFFGLRLAHGIRLLGNQKWPPTHVVAVPPKSLAERNRFALVFEAAKATGLVPSVQFQSNAVFCAKPEQLIGYKQMNFAQREQAAHQAYAALAAWSGPTNVLIVDDVHTSGSQARDVARAVLAAGATQTKVLTFGRDQASLVDQKKVAGPCPSCGWGELRLMPNRRDGSQFWGCSKWKRDGTGCNYKREA